MTKKLINIKNLNKKYILKNSNLLILKDINFEIYAGNVVSIMGPSGCGKSTFLNIIGMLDSEYEGKYIFLNEDVKHMSNYKKNILRNNTIGFVHQFFHLIPELTIWEM